MELSIGDVQDLTDFLSSSTDLPPSMSMLLSRLLKHQGTPSSSRANSVDKEVSSPAAYEPAASTSTRENDEIGQSNDFIALNRLS